MVIIETIKNTERRGDTSQGKSGSPAAVTELRQKKPKTNFKARILKDVCPLVMPINIRRYKYDSIGKSDKEKIVS